MVLSLRDWYEPNPEQISDVRKNAKRLENIFNELNERESPSAAKKRIDLLYENREALRDQHFTQ